MAVSLLKRKMPLPWDFAVGFIIQMFLSVDFLKSSANRPYYKGRW